MSAVMRRERRKEQKRLLAVAAQGVRGGQYVTCHRCQGNTVTLYDCKGGFTAACLCGNRATYKKRGQIAPLP